MATGSRDSEHIYDAVLRAAARKHLSIDKARIQNAIHPSDVIPHQTLKPAFRLRAI